MRLSKWGRWQWMSIADIFGGTLSFCLHSYLPGYIAFVGILGTLYVQERGDVFFLARKVAPELDRWFPK